MKTIFVLIIMLAAGSVSAQKVQLNGNWSITVISDSLTVKQSFSFAKKILPSKRKLLFDRYVLKNKTLYYKSCLPFSRVFVIKNGLFIPHKLS